METENRYLFRGISKETGDWVYGYVLFGSCNSQVAIAHSPAPLGGNVDHFTTDTVIPETVGQWTGIKDKEGNRIFEGDFVDYTKRYAGDINNSIGTWHVVWSDENCKHEVLFRGDSDADGVNCETAENMVVTGSVHDHLLKVSNSTGLE